MLPLGVRFHALCDIRSDADDSGLVLYFLLSDGGAAVLFLDHAEIEQRSFQFEESRHAPAGVRLQ